MGLSAKIMKSITDMGFEEASPIQSETIPIMLEGKDIIGQAQTGTGKTAAFAIPAIERLDVRAKDLQVIVLCPTRELVIQVTEEFRKLMKYRDDLAVVPVYGGQEIDRQLKALRKKPQIVVGTPGRTMDHMRRGSLKLEAVKLVVLDEADEMLDMGFREDIEIILKDTPAERQTVMFSATMPAEIMKLMKTYQKNPVRVDVTVQKINMPKIDQYYFEVQEKEKPEALARLLDLHDITRALVFSNTKIQVDNLVEILQARGYSADGLHGDLNQKKRDKVMGGFRTGRIEILVATDVACRGIDVSDIEAVFNYDIPRDDEDYIHRIGRTARAGKTGRAFSFVVGRQIYNLKRIEKINEIMIQRKSIPTLDDLGETRIKSYTDKIRQALSDAPPLKYIQLVENLMGDEFTAMDVAAALLKISMENKLDGFDESINFDDKPMPAAPQKKSYKKTPSYGQRKPFSSKPGTRKKESGFSGDKSLKKKKFKKAD